jgi:hypothetical protein
MTMKKDIFKPLRYSCDACGGHMISSYPGEFVRCPCGDCAVDQTIWYERHIGGKRTLVKEHDSSPTDNV